MSEREIEYTEVATKKNLRPKDSLKQKDKPYCYERLRVHKVK
jgi:hypothetical protein